MLNCENLKSLIFQGIDYEANNLNLKNAPGKSQITGFVDVKQEINKEILAILYKLVTHY